jgi:type IV secretory pathway VirB10-like protein
MAEQTINSEHAVPPAPELHRNESEPKGVLRKNLKVAVYLGAAIVVVLAAVLSSTGKKTGHQSSTQQHEPPQPAIQDNTDNNVQDLKNQLAAERQKEAQTAASVMTQAPNGALSTGTPAQQAASSVYGLNGQSATCMPGQSCGQRANANAEPRISLQQQQAEQLAAKERELAYNARFASNLVYAHPAESRVESPNSLIARSDDAGASQSLDQAAAAQSASNPVSARQTSEQKSNPVDQPSGKRSAQVNIDAAVGQPFVVYEGLTMDTILMNRLDGDAVGPVKALVSNPVYSHDRQHVLIPDGTIVLGEARKVGSSGFGQQRRLAVVFHRMIMPDGYSIDLDQFEGLDQIGELGLKDKVNNHYLQIFGTSIALGIISGAGEIESGGGTISTSGSQAFTTGAASSVSQSATTALDRFIQIPPTITIREGHRIKVYFSQDMLLPAYDSHTIPQTF